MAAAGEFAGDGHVAHDRSGAGGTDRPDPFAGPAWQATAVAPDDPAAPPAAVPVRRRRRRSYRRARRRRYVGLAMVVLGGLILLSAIWVLVTGLLARTQLNDLRGEVGRLHAQVAAGDLAGARATAVRIAEHAHRASHDTAGPVWALAAHLPAGGAPFGTIRSITAQLDTLGRSVLPQVVTATDRLDPSSLRRPDGRIDLARIASAEPTLSGADRALTRASTAIGGRPSRTWLGAVDTARADLLAQLTSLRSTVHSALVATRVVPAMLGEHGTKRYFVAFQNDAESRGTGGLPGAFGILRADRGVISFERFESDSTLGVVPTGLDYGPDYDQLFAGGRSTSLYVNSNLSPHFPYAARTWIAMWQRYAHERLDGAFALDPTALSYLLAVTGPTALTDGTRVTAGNVVALTQNTAYRRFPGVRQVGERKAFLLQIASAVSATVLHSGANTTALVKAAGRAGGERRVLIYSTSPGIEADLQQTSLSGAIPDTAAPFVGLTVVNVAGNKLDYYLERSLTWQRTGCGATRDVTVTVRLHDDVPPGPLTRYLTERHDFPDHPTRPGDNRLAVYYYASAGATLQSLTIDGQPSVPTVGALVHKAVFVADVELPRTATRTVVFHLREPAGVGAPVVLRQPLVRPLQVSLSDQPCG